MADTTPGSGPATQQKVQKTEEEWRELLTPEQFHVMRQKSKPSVSHSGISMSGMRVRVNRYGPIESVITIAAQKPPRSPNARLPSAYVANSSASSARISGSRAAQSFTPKT